MSCGCDRPKPADDALNRTFTCSPPTPGQSFLHSVRRGPAPNLNETFYLPEAVEPYFEPMTETYSSPNARPGRIRSVDREEFPNDSYDYEFNDEETEADVWSVYDRKSRTARRYSVHDEEGFLTPPKQVTATIPPGFRTFPERKREQSCNFNIRQRAHNSCNDTYDMLHLRAKGSSSRTYTSPQGHLRSDEEMSNVSRPSQNYDPHSSQSSLDTMSTGVDETTRHTVVRVPGGRMQQMSDSTRKIDIKVALPRNRPRTPQSCRKSPMSPIKRFDEAVNSELKKRMQCSGADTSYGTNLVDKPCLSTMGGRRSVATKSSLSAVELARSLHPDYYISGLAEAVDKLAQAEAACRFDGAVRAAEAAAAAFTDGIQAEEAAVAGVRGYHAELVDTINEEFPGAKPIELVGYIGVTRPRL